MKEKNQKEDIDVWDDLKIEIRQGNTFLAIRIEYEED